MSRGSVSLVTRNAQTVIRLDKNAKNERVSYDISKFTKTIEVCCLVAGELEFFL